MSVLGYAGLELCFASWAYGQPDTLDLDFQTVHLPLEGIPAEWASYVGIPIRIGTICEYHQHRQSPPTPAFSLVFIISLFIFIVSTSFFYFLTNLLIIIPIIKDRSIAIRVSPALLEYNPTPYPTLIA